MVAVVDTVDWERTLEQILGEHGPLHEDDIAQRLRDIGVADPDTLLDRLLDEIACPARKLVDDRWVWLPAILAGRVFTHRLDADELAHDLLTVTPDLDPITTLCEHEPYRQFTDGSAAHVVLAGFDDDLLEQRGIAEEAIDPLGALLLAPGTLAALGVAEGDLVGVRLTEQGLVVERVTRPGIPAPAAAAVGQRLAAMVDGEEPQHFDVPVWTACAEDPALFTQPLPPLCEIADDAGLASEGEWLAPSGFDFERWRLDRGCARLAERHGLDPDDAFALYMLVHIYGQMSRLTMEAADEDALPEVALAAAGADATTPEPAEKPAAQDLSDLVGELGAALADPLLAELLVAETVGTGRAGASGLGLLAEVLEPKVPRAAKVACRWLRAVALERLDDIEQAERELLAAESMDPDWPLPLFDLARIASDRGDAERGLSLLRRAGAAPDHPLVELLEQHRVQQRRDLGRNEPCWCGSGRKYKKCHLRREELPLPERTGWLYTKAAQYALLDGWHDELAAAGDERFRYGHLDPDALFEALADPLVMDAVLFEGGAFAEFLDVRGSLLPDDERLLAEQWQLAGRSVFEVEQVHSGHSVTVRDLRTGDTHEVHERAASRQLKVGQLICAHPLPTGDTMNFFGGIEPVELHQRDRLIDLLDTEPDPVTLVGHLSRRFAPPALANTEGDPLAICEATVRVGDPAEMEAALDDIYHRDDEEDATRWFEHVTTDGMPRIRAVLTLDGDELRVETNSEKRMDRVLATLARCDPAMEVLDDSRRPLRNARDVAELAKQLPAANDDAIDPDDPELAAFLDEFVRDYETTWLDQPLPALDGHTPRQAADDPTRRADLIRLLDTFPAVVPGTAGMDPDRLRAALGLG
ncbi:hypothetical protein MDOR_05260 [Mycolicibacterium doricum]|uniref:SEC-C motif-containing protein n=1 Tax=Mycolicibacterium doricum TaxID=126673 RepID=A0A7I7VNA7_9MYCO|nr:hypothetical protein MDOR_05260 [Mycolicibacterium doricum]